MPVRVRWARLVGLVLFWALLVGLVLVGVIRG
jgi:hypothetical protein